MYTMRQEAEKIIYAAIQQSMPETAVRRALADFALQGNAYVVSVGKAAWRMAKSAHEILGEHIRKGVIITKYGYSEGPLEGFKIFEAGHPIPDQNGVEATEYALSLVKNLKEEDVVVFLLSGGGSALFEKPNVELEELGEVTQQLLTCGANIVEINAIRKRLSAVKGGRFAQRCAPAKVYSVVLSDVIGDRMDMIASGPCCVDSSTCEDALAICERYGLRLSDRARDLIQVETPKEIRNVHNVVEGSVRQLCMAAKREAKALGYQPILLTTSMTCVAREAGDFLASIAREHAAGKERIAYISGGETVVRVRGSGKGGRNQELALSAAIGMQGIENALLFSVGSDGTDGPTDAAGGYADGGSVVRMRSGGIDPVVALENNDAYPALRTSGDLILTGPTGTNVNDLTVLLIGGR